MTTNSQAITDFKNATIAKLIGSDELMRAMGNDDIEANDEAVYRYIFPFFYIPYTIEEAHSYICMRVNMTGLNELNDSFGKFSLKIWVITHQDIMKISGVGGATRVDYMGNLIEGLLNGSDAFGTQRLRLVTNTEDSVDMRHRCRILTFTTQDFSAPWECG